MTPTFAQQIALLAFAGLLVWAAVEDAWRYRIANGLCLGVVALYVAYVMAGGLAGIAVDWLSGLAAAAAVFVGGFVLFSLRLVGGGDVKLLSAAGLWAGLADLPLLLVATCLAGGLLAVSLIAAKAVTLLRRPLELRPSGAALLRAAIAQPAPYGVAIAAGGLLVAATRAGVLT